MEIVHQVQNVRVGYGFHRSVGQLERTLPDVLHADLDFLDVRSQQSQRRECGRADRESLAGRCGRIAQRVERVGALAHFRVEAAHFGIAAGVVGDRSVGVRRQRDAERREHADGSDADAVQPFAQVTGRDHVVDVEARRAEEGENDGYCDRDDRNGRRYHAHADTGDDDRRRSRLGAFGDFPRRFVRMGRIVFGRLSDDDTGHEAYDHRERDADPVFDLQRVENAERANRDQRRARIDARAERAEQVFHRGALLRADQKDADDRQYDADGGDQHRGQHGLYLHVAREGGGSERRGRQNRTAIAFVKVGSHTGHVAYVVAHVIGYRCRVARIVFGDAGLDLADQIGSDVGRFRIDTSADPREERLR